jgi:hypothetical protein
MHEYMSSVDNTAKVGVDRLLAPTFKMMQTKIDKLLETIEQMHQTSLEFKKKYEENLEKKEKYYNE